MAEQITAGYKLYHGTIAAGNLIGIIKNIEPSYSGNDEDISGLNDTNSEGIIRTNMKPIDVNGTLSSSGILDRSQTGYSTFDSDMRNRAEDVVIGVERPDGTGMNYTGHSTSYNPESVDRGDATVKFSFEFQINSEAAYTP